MDAWQKLDIASKVFAAILVPLAVAYVGNQVAVANKQRDSKTKFVEIAAAILSKDPTANKTPESTNFERGPWRSSTSIPEFPCCRTRKRR
ncbi:MAG: hypothetical protein L6Q73_20450 [Aquabacterium sp.]|nr:hypothetical protein [Aquabacterium sp.]